MATRPASRPLTGLLSHMLACLLAATALVAAPRAQGTEPRDAGDAVDAAKPLSPRLAHLVDELENARRELHIPGMAIAVVQDDRVVLAHGFGLADVAKQTPVTAQTLFAIGSSTKAFTATLCAMLVDEGKLAWDDPITKSLPFFTLKMKAPEGGTAPAVASLRDLLSHRTGFSRNDVLWAGGRASRDEILRTAAGAEPWAPYRTEFLYNNVQVMAAGEAAALAAGTSWDALVTTRLLDPLGMSSSNTSITKCADDPRLALGYAWEEDRQDWRHLPMRNLDCIAPAGAINSNVLDMAQWVRLQLGHGAIGGQRLVSEAALDEMWSPQMKVGKNTQYGLCWFLSEWEGHEVVEHGGNIDGFAAEVALLPDDGVGFVLLANVSATPLQSTSRAMVWKALLGPEPALADADAAAQAGGDGTPAPFEDYVGAYTANSPGFRDQEMRVLVQDGHLAVDVPGQTIYALKAPDRDGRWFFAVTDTISVSFARDAAGRVISMTMEQGGGAFEAPRVGVELVVEEPLEGLRKYLGDYEMPGMRMTAMIHNQRLALDVPGQMIYELSLPQPDGSRRFRALPGFSVSFVEQDGQVASLDLHQPDGEYSATRVPGSEPVDEASAGLPTVEALLALRGASATDAAWLALDGVRLTGTIRFANAGLTGRAEWNFAGLDRFRQDLDLGVFGFARDATDGHAAWSESTFASWRELHGDELAQALQGHPAAIFGDWRRVYDSLRVLRRDSLDGRDVLVLELKQGSLPVTTLTVDAVTAEPLRAESTQVTPGQGSQPQDVRFSDWRDVGGVRLPFRISTKNEDTGRIDLVFETAETGVAPGAATFQLEQAAAR